MSIIKVENIGKKYIIGHQRGGTERYRGSLREAVTHWGRSICNRLKHPLKVTSGADIDEDFWALRDINFEIQPGDRVGIIGRNGSGKSTLLKVLSRITEPSTGMIELRGRIASLLEVGTGFHPDLTGRENIFLNGAILGLKVSEIKQKFDEIVDFAEIEKFLDTPVKRYSSGMYVRLAFAVAAHLEPEILLVDEVLAVGDVQFQKKCLGKMGEVSKSGRTILFVSHNMGAIEQLCNRCMVLNRGQLNLMTDNVNDGIKNYLSNCLGTVCAEWINENEIRTNDYFMPLSMRLINGNGGAVVNCFGNNEDVWIEIIGRVKNSNDLLQIGYALYSDDDQQLLYWSTQADEENSHWPKLIDGCYKFSSKLPRRFLNEGSYRIELLSVMYCREWLYHPGNDGPTIRFEVSGGLSDSSYWTQKRPGIMAPVIPWSAEKID